MSASVHSICAIVVLVGTVTSSLGMHIADAGDDVILSSDECLRCKLAILDGARISCERCFLQPSERIYDFSERRQPTVLIVDESYGSESVHSAV
jgi:hypothetical protein